MSDTPATADTPATVLCLGIDAASPKLLRQWAADGLLPNIQSLMDRGLSGDLKGIQGFFVGSTWPSMYTGLSPAGHGFHYLVQIHPRSYDFFRPAEHGISRREPFWSHLSRAGKRVAILDVPLTRLDPTVNGIQVVEWGGHDSVYGFEAHPEPLAEELRSRFGLHPGGISCDGNRRTPEDYEAFLGTLLEGVRTKSAITRHLLQKGGWDFFMQVFTESHCVGHQCWHLHDRAHPAYDPDIAEAVGDPLLRVYQAIDTAVGEILEEAGEATVVLFSGHDMSYWYGTQFLLRDALLRLGAAKPVPGRSAPGISTPLAILRFLWRGLPEGIKDFLGPLREKVRPSEPPADRLPTIDVDLASSSCFPAPNGLSVGGIRLNLKGRDPSGVLAPEDADAFVSDLIADLLAIRERRTGRPLIRAVQRTADLYEGEFLEGLPDLLVEWSDQVPIGSIGLGDGSGAAVQAYSEKTGVLEGRNEYGRSGEHRPDGMVVAAGPGIGARSGPLERRVSLLDLAPTLTRLLGVDLPDCEGSPIEEVTGG